MVIGFVVAIWCQGLYGLQVYGTNDKLSEPFIYYFDKYVIGFYIYIVLRYFIYTYIWSILL